MAEIFIFTLVVIAGLAFGSFANVLIYRIPRKKSIVSPGSFCPECGSKIFFYDNIPVISWIILKGKCRKCGKPIPFRYPLVEIFSAVIFTLSYLLFGLSVDGFLAIFFLYVLLIISFIDLELRVIPNKIIYPATLVTLLLATLMQLTDGSSLPLLGKKSLSVSIFSGVAVFILMFLIDLAGRKIYKKEGIGAGDIKLSFFMGLFLGYYVFLAVFFAFLFGAISGSIALAIRRKKNIEDSYMPMGPFLSLGSFVTLIYGEKILNWYLTLIT